MRALHEVVQAGNVRYIGASSMYAWRFAKGAAHHRGGWLDQVRVDAEPLQPGVTRREAGDPALRGSGHGSHFPGVRWRALLAGTREGPSGAPFGQALTRSHHASHGTAPEGIMRW